MKGRTYRKLLKRGAVAPRTVQRMRSEIRRREGWAGAVIGLGFAAICGVRALDNLARACRRWVP